jgi:hypothetical protein
MVNETASTRNATSAARNTGSRGSPRIVFAPPPSPLFGILILMATVSTHTPILFRRFPPQKGLTPRVTQFRVVRIHITRRCPALSRTLRHNGILTFACSQNTPQSGTQTLHSDKRAQRARRNPLHPPWPPRHTTPVDECRRCSHCTPASLDEKRPAVHAGLPAFPLDNRLIGRRSLHTPLRRCLENPPTQSLTRGHPSSGRWCKGLPR